MKILKLVVLASGIFGAAVIDTALAEEIYKSVGRGGVIEYSTVPPDSGKTIGILTVPPEPSEADIRAAQQKLKQLSDDLDQREQARAEANEPETEESTTEESGNPPLNPNPFPMLAPFLNVATNNQ